MPAFENLFPDLHNTQVMKLLFLLAHWHSLAKLRLHTDETLTVFEKVTICLGEELCTFTKVTCAAFSTKELRREAEARKRHQVRNNAATRSSTMAKVGDRRPKVLNLQTYKLHALGDYPSQIWLYGTTDSFTSQIVSCHMPVMVDCDMALKLCDQGEAEHRTSKRRFPRTNKRNFIPQLASIERRQTRIRRIRAEIEAQKELDPVSDVPEQHHVIGKTQNFPVDIVPFVQSHLNDLAAAVGFNGILISINHSLISQDFAHKLKLHLLPRIQAMHGCSHSLDQGLEVSQLRCDWASRVQPDY